MAPRNNKQKNNKMPSRAAAPVAPAPVRAPMPSNTYGGNVRYIENLYPKGTKDYNYFAEKVGPGYDGGNYASTTGRPGVDAASDDDLRAYAKAVALKGATYDFGDMPGVRAAAAEFDAQQASQGQAAQAQTASPTANYKGINSIKGGLKLGGDDILGRREAMKIARNTGRSYDDVLGKALGSGFSIGGGAVRQSNKASGTSQVTPMFSGQKVFTSGSDDSPLGQMRRVTPGRGQMYSGTYQLDGQTAPIVESRRGGTNPLTGMTGGGRNVKMPGGGGRKRGGGKGRRGGRGGMGDTSMGTQPTATATAADFSGYTPSMDQQMPEPDININMPGVGESLSNFATGFRRKQGSRKRAGRSAQGFASQRVSPTSAMRFGL